jgi:hypothetical protein
MCVAAVLNVAAAGEPLRVVGVPELKQTLEQAPVL